MIMSTTVKTKRSALLLLILFAIGIGLLLSTQFVHADYYETSNGRVVQQRCIMFNYLQDGYKLVYYGHVDEIKTGDEYIAKVEQLDDGTTRDAVFRFTFDSSIKSGDYMVTFVDGQWTNTIYLTDSFKTSTKYNGNEEDVDGYFKTRTITPERRNRISVLGDVRFNYAEEGSYTFFLRLRKATGMVIGDSVKVSPSEVISVNPIDDKTLAICLDKNVTSGTYQAELTFKRGNPWLGKIYEDSFTVEFTDCASSGSMDVGFFIPMASGKFDLYQAGRGDVVYKTVDGLGQAAPGTVEIDTAVSNAVGYTPELNYYYKNTTPGEMTSDNPLITVSCELETVPADDWVLSYQAKKPYVIATLSDDAPPGDHQATVHGKFPSSSGGYDITYTVIFHKEEASIEEPPAEVTPVAEIFADVPSNAWYKDYLQKAYSNNIIGGMSASEYAPQSNLTHGQIIVMIANLHNLQNGGAYDFQANKTTGGHWCSAYLEYCKAEGLLDERFDGVLNNNVNRGEMAYYFARAISEESYKEKKTVELVDVSGNPYLADIMKLAGADIVGGYDDKTYRAEKLVTRAEAAVFISNIIDAIKAE